MKIALLTWTYSNYGTQLQAYSMCTYLKKLGHEVEFVNYLTSKEDVLRYGTHNISYQFKRVLRKLKQIKTDRRMNTVVLKYKADIDAKEQKFKEFMSTYLPLTRKYSKNELAEISDCYDLYIVGSDQVWSPKYLDGSFFLDFVSDKEKVAAYAPSFGVNHIDDEIKGLVSEWLKNFKFLSVREINGQQIVQELIGKTAQVVLDPTFLFDQIEWCTHLESKKQQTDKYILCYFLSENRYYWKVVNKVATELGYKVIIIPNTPDDFECEYDKKIAVSPFEFVKLIKDASYVITDSFHGTAFSINLGVDFITLARFSEKSVDSENSRIKSILQLLDMTDRFVTSDEITCRLDILQEEWDNCKKCLNANREVSKLYIDTMLGR